MSRYWSKVRYFCWLFSLPTSMSRCWSCPSLFVVPQPYLGGWGESLIGSENISIFIYAGVTYLIQSNHHIHMYTLYIYTCVYTYNFIYMCVYLHDSCRMHWVMLPCSSHNIAHWGINRRLTGRRNLLFAMTGFISKAASWGYNQDWNVLKPLDKRLVVVPLFFVGYAHRSSFVWKGYTHSPFGYKTLCLRCQHSSTNSYMMLTSQRHQQLRPFNCIIWVHLNQLSVVKWSDVIGPWFQRPSVAKAVWTAGGSECDTKVNRCSEHCAKAFCFPSFFWIYVVCLFVFCVSEHGISLV